MEEKPLPKSAMVSRLPKFGARPAPGVTSPQPNGSPQPAPPSHEGKTAPPARPNGVVHASSFSLKWRKDGGSAPPTDPDGGPRPEERGDKAQTPLPPLGKGVKKASPATPKVRRSVSSVSSGSKAVLGQQASKTSPKAGTGVGQSPLGGCPDAGQNSSAAVAGRPVSRSCLARPRATSISPRSSSRDSLYQSSDSLRSPAPADNMVRSQSFTHFTQIPSPTGLPMMTRSFSFTRAVELAKPLANTQLRTPRTSFIKPPQYMANGRAGPGLGSPGGLQYGRESSSSVLAPPTTPSSALRKPLLPNGVLSKPSALGYRPARPGQTKQHKPLVAGVAKGEAVPGSVSVAGLVGGGDVDPSPPLSPDTPVGNGRTPGGSGRLRDTPSQSYAGEGLEDMSLSSASSLERNDTSEEFLDDFDNPGDAGEGEAPDNRKRGNSAQTRLRSFLNETMDWARTDGSGRKEEVGVRASRGVLSSEEGEFLQGSSLELSPSNSSGGTYMWDEEGLEPLRGPGTHPCDDDSDLNSMDILNHLEHVDPGDLEEDDLMLDVDLPDDRSLHTDAEGMAHFDRSERGGRQGHWRRRQHRWNGPDHFHNDNRGPVFQQFDGLGGPGSFRLGPRPLPPVGRADSQQGVLDQLALRHMAQDCSSVKNQLLKLKSLLQMEDGCVVPDLVEDSEDNTALQLEDLMKEVRVLRDELKMKNRTIAQLTTQQQQLQQQQQANAHIHPGRCLCHQRAASTRADRRTRYDKSTQTPWRGHGHAGVLPAPLLSPWQSQHPGSPRASMPQRRQTSSTTAFQPLPQRAAPPGKTSKNSPHRGPQ